MKEKEKISKVEYVEVEYVEDDPIVHVRKSVWLDMIKKRNQLAKHNIELSQQRDFWKKKFIAYPKLSKKEIKQLLYVIDFLTDEYTLTKKSLKNIINKFEKILKK